MKNKTKKAVVLGIYASLIACLVFSFVFTAVYAWFYKDAELPLPLNPANFNASILIDGKTEETEILYSLPAPTILTFDSDTLPYPEYKDTMFNACVRRTLISIENTGNTEFYTFMGIEAAEAVTTYTDAGGTLHEIKLTATESAPIKSLKVAVIDKDFENGEDILTDGGYPDYRKYIDLQMNIPGGGRYASLEKMNEGYLQNTLVQPGDSAVFTLAIWADYDELCKEFGYGPQTGIIRSTVYTVRLKVRAESVRPG